MDCMRERVVEGGRLYMSEREREAIPLLSATAAAIYMRTKPPHS